MERYELVEGKSSKFWEASVEGATLTVRYGRIGTQGQSKDKEFSSPEAAEHEKKKLVKEKTAKGYVPAKQADGAAAAAATPPEPASLAPLKAAKASVPAVTAPAPQEPVSPVSAKPATENDESPAAPAGEDRQQLEALLWPPLPTRSRPLPPIDPARVWAELIADLERIRPHTEKAARQASDWLEENRGDSGPKSPSAPGLAGRIKSAFSAARPAAPLDAGTARQWLENLRLASGGLTIERDGKPRQSAGRLCLRAFLAWLLENAGIEVALAAAEPLIGTSTRRGYGYESSSWSSSLDLALRDVVTALPPEQYENAVERLTAAFHADTEWRRKAAFAFVLGDDRPVEHDLRPLSVLQAAQADGEDVGAQVYMVPLIVDAPPSDVARWRSKRSYFIYFTYFDIGLPEIAATVLANARQYGEPPLAGLEWLLHYGYEGQRTTLARIILATGEDAALPTLIPYLHEKWIRAALDEAIAANPALAFRQLLSALASGRAEPVLRARLVELVKQYPHDVLSAWAGSAKSLSYLEKLLEARQSDIAPAASLPDFLKDPPWRRKAKKSEDLVLDLAPLATPFRYQRTEEPPEQNYWRQSRARVIATTDELVKAIAEIEAKDLPDWYKVPPATDLPKPGDSEEKVLGFVSRRINEIASTRSYALTASGWSSIIGGMTDQPEALALTLWQCPGVVASYYMGDIFPRMMDRFGERALPGLIRQVENDPIGMLERVGDVDAAEIAPLAARGLLKLKKARVPAMQWLRRHPRTAITRLIPDAVGKKGAARDAAEHALRWLARERADARGEIEAVAGLYEAQSPETGKAVAEVLDRDPFGRYPARIAKLPAWFSASALLPPVLKSGEGALPEEAVTAIAEMLSFSTPEAVYAGIDALKEIATADSLARFSWDLFSVWLSEGAPGKDGWALRAVGWLGDDECARQLTRLIRKWPGESAHQRAVTGLDVLADIGSDVALMNLNGIAEKLKFKGLQERAREKIAALAEARDLTAEELADRLVPDLDLDERGGMALDFGPRSFHVGFDEFLKPWVKDAAGKRLKDLPKPVKSDDAELSAAAVKRWSALKKDARAVASLQITRLENMLSSSRRVAPDVFWNFFASHPLIRHLTQRLVWGLYGDRDPRSAPKTVFRVSDDLSLTDAQDETIEVDLSATAEGFVGLVHPLHMPDGGLDAWGALFGDYEISQPFPQLGREIHALDEAEKATREIARFENLKVESARLRGMGARGWNLGAPQDSGCIWWLERPVQFPDGSRQDVLFYFSDGLFTGGADFEDKLQTLGKLSLEPPYGRNKGAGRTFGELDPVTASEMLRGLALLAETAAK